MKWYKSVLTISTHGKGFYVLTDQVNAQLRLWKAQEGMCFLYCPHTSASLTINESYDPTAQADLETALEKMVPDTARWYSHDLEGPDDATSHIRTMLTGSSLMIPVDDGRLTLGTWQGVYLCEHRSYAHRREVWMRVMDVFDESKIRA
ncbi:MAG: secondary thiamine-phosphate synthase enzyme [Anaerolineae bacterium]|nr:MAG: secondary thiamine-phosphate synthase enzyme [Anaerolineae bacterium]